MTDLSQNNQATHGKTGNLVRGCVLLLLGAWMGVGCIQAVLYILRTQIFDSWFTSDTALRIAAAAFFIWVGSRFIRRHGQEVSPTRIGWGRLLVGVVLIYVQVRDYFVPTPNLLKPDNESQAAGMRFVDGLIYLAGVALIVGAFLKRKHKPVAAGEQNTSAAPQR